MTKKIKKDIKEAVYKKYGCRCFYCKKIIDGVEMPVDHKTPRIAGGGDTISNLVPCCNSCNSAKRDRNLDEWLEKAYLMKFEHMQALEKWATVVEVLEELVEHEN